MGRQVRPRHAPSAKVEHSPRMSFQYCANFHTLTLTLTYPFSLPNPNLTLSSCKDAH